MCHIFCLSFLWLINVVRPFHVLYLFTECMDMLSVCLFVFMQACMLWHVKARGHPSENYFLLPCGFQGSYLVHQAW